MPKLAHFCLKIATCPGLLICLVCAYFYQQAPKRTDPIPVKEDYMNLEASPSSHSGRCSLPWSPQELGEAKEAVA